MKTEMMVNSPEYRRAVEDAKDRIIINLDIMRKEYPHLFK